jgi:hypothetical protein
MTITIHNEDGSLALTGQVDSERRRMRTLEVEDAAAVVQKLFISLPTLLGTLEAAIESGRLTLKEVSP